MEILTKGNKVNHKDLIQFESKIGNYLPEPFKEFIITENPITIKERHIQKGNNTYEIHAFFPFKTDGHWTLEQSYDNLKEYYKNQYLGFAQDCGGWEFIICIAKNQNFGKVYFCRMDTEIENAKTLIAENFTKFISNLHYNPNF